MLISTNYLKKTITDLIDSFKSSKEKLMILPINKPKNSMKSISFISELLAMDSLINITP